MRSNYPLFVKYPSSYLGGSGEKWLDEPFPSPRTGPIHLLIVEAVSIQSPTTIHSIVGLKHESAPPFFQVGHLFRNAVRDDRDPVYIDIYIFSKLSFRNVRFNRCFTSQKQSWLDADERKREQENKKYLSFPST